MDTRTGQIYEAESAAALAKKLGCKEGDIAMLDKLPDNGCRKCHGTGKRRAGMFSRRFTLHEGGMGEGSAMSKVERIRRLDRWAETAMRELMEAQRHDADVPKAQANIARSAWNMAVAMEDERTRVIEALRNLEPVEI